MEECFINHPLIVCSTFPRGTKTQDLGVCREGMGTECGIMEHNKKFSRWDSLVLFLVLWELWGRMREDESIQMAVSTQVLIFLYLGGERMGRREKKVVYIHSDWQCTHHFRL